MKDVMDLSQPDAKVIDSHFAPVSVGSPLLQVRTTSSDQGKICIQTRDKEASNTRNDYQVVCSAKEKSPSELRHSFRGPVFSFH